MLNQKVTISGCNIISSLGFSSKENFRNVLNGVSGLQFHSHDPAQPLALIDNTRFNNYCVENQLPESFSKFEKLCILSMRDALSESSVKVDSEDCLIILATTKGNIGMLETENKRSESIHLWESARKISEYFRVKNFPLVISNACVSSVMAQVLGLRMLDGGQYKNIVVCGADLITDFVLKGFQSFKALSPAACRPYDLNRDGLSLGEGAGSIVFSVGNSNALFDGVCGISGASSNDANHISGPSRTGDGLANAIFSTLNQADVRPEFISTHGTATPYNDEMESKAINLVGLQEIPANSLKSYYGHTLGAAGVIETITTLMAMESSKAIGTLGHVDYGMAEKINLAVHTRDLAFNSFLKIASGFGGCNAAILFSK